MTPDWFRVITDLINLGLSMHEIGRTLGVDFSRDLVRHYRNGTQPLYVRGEALLRLWSQRTGRPVDEVPRVPFYPPYRASGRRVRAVEGRA
jgi:hypothetical protein